MPPEANDSSAMIRHPAWLSTSAGARWALAAILVLALVVRVAAALAFPSLHHPDEAFQLFEPAHSLAFGWGVKTWEFDDGIRSMVAPAALAAIFRVAAPIVGGPGGYIAAARIALAALSLPPVLFIFRAGARESRVQAVTAAFVAAIWFEIVYFSFRPLTEALACDFALTALALISPPGRALSVRTLLGVGLCLALTALLRLQLSPGAALVAAAAARNRPRRWLLIAAGATPALILFGVADWIAWGAPFASYYRAVAINLGAGRASAYGVQTWSWYLLALAALWGPFLPVAFALWIVRLRRSWPWLAFAAVEIAVHSAIPHKEYRFVFPAFAVLAIVAAQGSADVAQWLTGRFRDIRTGAVTAIVLLAWASVSVALAASPQFRPEWTHSRGELASEYWLASRSDLCGVLFFNSAWFDTGGYAFFHRRAPLYFPVYEMRPTPDGRLEWPRDMAARREAAANAQGAYNYVILSAPDLARFEPRYHRVRCFDGPGALCAFERQGDCAPDRRLTPILRRARLGEPLPTTP